ncbi:MAG: RNA polymerase sigma-I factor [Bacillota bacterium]|uniref:RNA polymerase sigma-I factor n=1 Tax=Fictibacillus TaxID=1329200 RepID=UPI0011A4A0F1|nr:MULTISPECIES: RNA polymerase sigma-I factor [Fictibacillus]MBH0169603.1 RNA polymerase sigma-I factor [Fictibacillus sp. 18YEL24]
MASLNLNAVFPIAKNKLSSNKLTSIEDKVLTIQEKDDEKLRNELIGDYQPFIKKVTSKVCSQYIDRTMDEFSVGLFAFNEAIDQYQEGQGSRFLSFADMVIRRRVIDYIRKEVRQNRLIFLQPDEEDEEGRLEESYAEQKAAMDHFEDQIQVENRVYEIEEYQKLLKTFGLNFKVLSKHCPKHVDARENAKEIARLLAENEELAAFLKEKKQLPIKDLLNMVSCSRKTIERNRKYIIAVSLIYLGDFQALKSYIQP